jgi:PAS domain-containing protein
MPEWQRPDVLTAVFDKLSDAIVLYDKDLTITGVNRAAERLFEMSADEMVGNSCRSVFKCGQCDTGCGMLMGITMDSTPPVAWSGSPSFVQLNSATIAVNWKAVSQRSPTSPKKWRRKNAR